MALLQPAQLAQVAQVVVVAVLILRVKLRLLAARVAQLLTEPVAVVAAEDQQRTVTAVLAAAVC